MATARKVLIGDPLSSPPEHGLWVTGDTLVDPDGNPIGVGGDEKVRVSGTDTTQGYLGAKLSAGANISFAVLNPGANEILQITAAPSGYTTVQDEGTPLPQRSILNFIGLGVTASDVGGLTQIQIFSASPTQQGSIALTGDLGGSAASPSVLKLRGRAIGDLSLITDRQILAWDVTSLSFLAVPQPPTVTMPGSPGQNTQVAYAQGGNFAYATNVRILGNALALGTDPVASTGDLRVEHGFTFKGRDQGNSNDRNLLDWGLTVANQLTVGDSAVPLELRSSTFGIFGATPVAKPTISGAKQYNSALGSILAAGVALGVWTDSTTQDVGAVAAWFVNASTGNDSNDGLTSGTALASIEELSRRLSPGGAACRLQQNTTVTVAAGSYGELSLNLDSTFTLKVLCAYTSGSSITLSSVVNTNSATLTRGELVTASGTFIAKRRIRSTSGANVGAITYSTGLNGGATDTFVGSWLSTAFAVVTIANGTTVAIDTLVVSFATINLQTGQTGSVEIHDAIVSFVNANPSNGNIPSQTIFFGCELSGYFSGTYAAYACRTTNFVAHSRGVVQYAGTVVQQRIDIGADACFRSGGGNTWDGAPLVVDFFGSALLDAGGEWENGSGISTAIAVAAGSVLQIIGKVWGASTNYTRGVQLDSGALAITSSTALLAIPATTQVTLGGGVVSLTYSQLPASLPVSNSAFVVNPAPASSQALFGNVSTPFRATYYIDPTFTGTSNGSQSNPFTTCGAAFTAALALSLTVATLKLAPGCTLTENVVFPTTGDDWEIVCDHAAAGTVAATINGTVTATATATVRYRLTNVRVSGNISGNSGGSSQLILAGAIAAGSIAMTGNWAAVQFLGRVAPNLNSFGGSVVGTVSVAGPIFALMYTFAGAIDWSVIGTVFYGCRFNTASFTLNGSIPQGAQFIGGCQFVVGPLTFTSANNNLIQFDSYSMAAAIRVGVASSGAGVLSTGGFNANAPAINGFNNNVGASNVTGQAPAGLYEASGTLDLITQGTSGTAVLNVIYTDLTGTTQTLAVTNPGLSVTAAVGTEVRGQVIFRHNGSTAIQYSITGISSPGSLTGSVAIAIARLD